MKADHTPTPSPVLQQIQTEVLYIRKPQATDHTLRHSHSPTNISFPVSEHERSNNDNSAERPNRRPRPVRLPE